MMYPGNLVLGNCEDPLWTLKMMANQGCGETMSDPASLLLSIKYGPKYMHSMGKLTKMVILYFLVIYAYYILF